MAPDPVSKLSVVTFNVWFSSYSQRLRAVALLELLDQLEPDVIALQEITDDTLPVILAEDWVRNRYWISDATGTTYLRYGVVLMSRLPVDELAIHELSSGMGRTMLVAKLACGITAATVHLESTRAENASRQRQLEEIFPILAPCEHAILMGDFNFCSTWPENELLDPAYVDVWPALQPDHPGWTEDPTVNRMRLEHRGDKTPVRFDRILLRSAGALWQPTAIELLGTEPVSPAHPDVYLSDHFGLLARFRRSTNAPCMS